jgi:hypothetical protein
MQSEGATIKSIVGNIFGYDVGDKVVFQKSMKAEIVAKVEGSEKPYGIKYVTPTGDLRTIFTKYEHLSYRKSKDQLEKGDKFRNYENEIIEILCVGYNNYYNQKEYYCRVVNGDHSGKTTIFIPDAVEEVIIEC